MGKPHAKSISNSNTLLNMFETLESLQTGHKGLLSQLQSVPKDRVRAMQNFYPGCPESYWNFLIERGTGFLSEEVNDPFFFCFNEKLMSAEKDYFLDRQIYENGAKGDILIFGFENMGTAYGFDTGDEWKMVEVDELRIVTPLMLSFHQFVVGLVLCYPQIAIMVAEDEWVDGVGTRYKMNPQAHQ
jgi:hypothetical protein